MFDVKISETDCPLDETVSSALQVNETMQRL
jgi:hypothetical protein